MGIYAATSKIAMVMAMFTQAFRYAYEPFVFGKDREGDNRKMYAAAMTYFLAKPLNSGIKKNICTAEIIRLLMKI